MSLTQIYKFSNVLSIRMRDPVSGRWIHGLTVSDPITFDLVVEIAPDVAPEEGGAA